MKLPDILQDVRGTALNSPKVTNGSLAMRTVPRDQTVMASSRKGMCFKCFRAEVATKSNNISLAKGQALDPDTS